MIVSPYCAALIADWTSPPAGTVIVEAFAVSVAANSAKVIETHL
jgi:hypothetical protein